MKIITRTVMILSVVSLLNDIASEMLYPVIPVYLKDIGFSALWIGILEGVANFTAGISKGYFGKRSDEKGLRLPFIKLGYLLSAVSKPLLVTFAYPLWVFILRAADRLGKGVRTAARDAILSKEATPATKGRVFGFHRTMDTAGAAIGPALALVFLFFFPRDYPTLFYLAFIPGLLSIFLLFMLKEKRSPESTLRNGNFLSFFRYWSIASAEYKKVTIGLLLFALFNSSDFFLLLITRESIGTRTVNLLGMTFGADTLTIAAYVFYNLVYALLSYPMGALADKFSFRSITVTGFLIFALVYGSFAFHPSVGAIFGLFALYGVYSAATDGVIKAWITNLSGTSNTATAIGFYTSCESICTLLASIIAGALWSFSGSMSTFIVTSVIALGASAYLILLPRNSVAK